MTTTTAPTINHLSANIRAAITSGVSANKKARKNVRALINHAEGLPVIEGIVKDYSDQNRTSQDTNKANNKAFRKSLTIKLNKEMAGQPEAAIKKAISDTYNQQKTKADSTAWDLIRKIIPSEFKKVGLNASVSASDGSITIEPLSDDVPEKGNTSSKGSDKQPEANRDIYAEAFDAAMLLKDESFDNFKTLIESLQNVLANSQEEKKAA